MRAHRRGIEIALLTQAAATEEQGLHSQSVDPARSQEGRTQRADLRVDEVIGPRPCAKFMQVTASKGLRSEVPLASGFPPARP